MAMNDNVVAQWQAERLCPRAPAAGEDHDQRPERLSAGRDPLGQADSVTTGQLRGEPADEPQQPGRRRERRWTT